MVPLEARGIKLSQLNAQVLGDVFRLYDATVGGQAVDRLTDYPIEYYLTKIQQALQIRGDDEWRFGSRISRHSKLRIKRKIDDPDTEPEVVFTFDPNTVLNNPAAGAMAQAFNTELSKYFQEAQLIPKQSGG